ncbi:MAG: EscU/YscU/HrcU family type III secretion system export apparatus switch protein [Verrucomicrobiae bacterium]|nr:EscU/YscU/HrcU family type III secretion system export apparatus switch protein [Verrucomicrobiae bacterium]
MSEQVGEKTEQPTPRRLEDAWKKGQFARSTEIQTVFVLGAGFLALLFTSREIWRILSVAVGSTLGHLHEVPLTPVAMHGHVVSTAVALGQCLWPIMAATILGGLLAGGIQSRFRTAPEALEAKWERLSVVSGFKRVFSIHSTVTAGIALLKLTVIVALTAQVIRGVLDDPIFTAMVDVQRINLFMADSARKIILRVLFALMVIAALDYGYQFWKNHRDMMMTRQEVKDEMKNTEGNPQVRAQQRRRRQGVNQRKMLMDVPQADVVVTNPTHLAIALRYDRRTMKAPRIVAKGSRLNALRIREVARQHQVPILEDKPLARLMFKHGRVGGEIPAQVFAAVAEVLAWVYRVNAYRYYREQHAGT